MAKTIDNFLIGVGYDVDKKSMEDVGSGIDNLKSKALLLGSVVSGALGMKKLVSDFAEAKDELGKFSQVFGVTADDIQSMGNALRLEGGTLDDFMNQLASLEKFRAGIRVGDIGFMAEAQKAGIDTDAIINASTAAEAYLMLGDQFRKLSAQQRINAAEALGFDDAAIRLLSKGTDEIAKIVAKQKEMRSVTESMTNAAAKYNDEFQNIETNVGGVLDIFAEQATANAASQMERINELVDENRELIRKGAKAVAGFELDAETFLVSPAAALFRGITGGDGVDGSMATNQIQENMRTDKKPSELKSQPIVIKNQLILDGKVIDERVTKTVGEMADRAIEDLSSQEGG